MIKRKMCSIKSLIRNASSQIVPLPRDEVDLGVIQLVQNFLDLINLLSQSPINFSIEFLDGAQHIMITYK